MGSIAKRHVKNLRLLHPDARILAVSSSRTNTICPDGADAVVDIASVLRQSPRYAVVASPAPFHTGIASTLLGAGIPVLIEKPLSADYESARAFADSYSNQTAPLVRVGYCLRFLSTAGMVRVLLEENRIGKIQNVASFVGQYLPHWRPGMDYRESVSARKEMGGGALLELSHELDLLNWFFNDLSLAHSWLRTGMGLGLEVEECADLALIRPDGCYLSVHLDFLQKDVCRHMEFFGSEGRMMWDLVANTIDITKPGVEPEQISGTETDRDEMYLSMLTEFEGALEGRPDGLATLDAALSTMALIDYAKQENAWNPQT
ncbi:Gfo/Idh/MocA family oxidoreductase [uncultured Sulfitobacter sp.]|uniref:Gfo/Idh/MocA family protein n=1 Tax=uncultured Sulfitobacter sp. TaxID=191468 RepID=UPI0030D77523